MDEPPEQNCCSSGKIKLPVFNALHEPFFTMVSDTAQTIETFVD